MKMSRLIPAATLILISVVVSCNVLRNEDQTADLRQFVSSFQASLTQSDEEILKQFQTSQSKESILSAIRILQNKEVEYIECIADFSDFSILGSDEFVTIQVQATFTSKNVEQEYKNDATFDLKLKRDNKSYVIAELKAEEFYSAFALMRNEMEWAVERETENKLRQPIYARAQQLQQNFDSVIWFARYKDVNYFYVVEGSWSIEKFRDNKSECLMGIVDGEGKVIVPVEYDFIGTIGFSDENIVEVGKDGKVGHFDMVSKQLSIEPAYDFIIPYDNSGVLAIVKQDSVYGWLNNEKQFVAGFPSKEAEEWIKTYSFLPENLRISYEMEGLCEPPTSTEIGRGVVMPPSYLVASGIFLRVIDGVTTTKFPMHGWTEYIETKGARVTSIGENLSALIATVTSRYLDGREEFYTENRLVFINDRHDTLAVSGISTDKEMEISRVDSSLIQIKSYSQWWGEPYPEDNGDLPDYTYFRIDGNTITPLTSTRVFKPSQFVKLDSTYLAGKFVEYDENNDRLETTFLSEATIKYFRNEILAEYGYRFTSPEDVEKFNTPRYQPRFDNIDEFRDQMTDVDKHNIAFLDQIISRMQDTAF